MFSTNALPSALTSGAPARCTVPHTPAQGTRTCTEARGPPQGVLALPGARGVMTCLPSSNPHEATSTGFKAPAPLDRPKTPLARPHSLVLAPHDLVLVGDELVYIFQIKLVRHSAAALVHARSEPFSQPQPQLPPAGNNFASS